MNNTPYCKHRCFIVKISHPVINGTLCLKADKPGVFCNHLPNKNAFFSENTVSGKLVKWFFGRMPHCPIKTKKKINWRKTDVTRRNRSYPQFWSLSFRQNHADIPKKSAPAPVCFWDTFSQRFIAAIYNHWKRALSHILVKTWESEKKISWKKFWFLFLLLS